MSEEVLQRDKKRSLGLRGVRSGGRRIVERRGEKEKNGKEEEEQEEQREEDDRGPESAVKERRRKMFTRHGQLGEVVLLQSDLNEARRRSAMFIFLPHRERETGNSQLARAKAMIPSAPTSHREGGA